MSILGLFCLPLLDLIRLSLVPVIIVCLVARGHNRRAASGSVLAQQKESRCSFARIDCSRVALRVDEPICDALQHAVLVRAIPRPGHASSAWVPIGPALRCPTLSHPARLQYKVRNPGLLIWITWIVHRCPSVAVVYICQSPVLVSRISAVPDIHILFLRKSHLPPASSNSATYSHLPLCRRLTLPTFRIPHLLLPSGTNHIPR